DEPPELLTGLQTAALPAQVALWSRYIRLLPPSVPPPSDDPREIDEWYRRFAVDPPAGTVDPFGGASPFATAPPQTGPRSFATTFALAGGTDGAAAKAASFRLDVGALAGDGLAWRSYVWSAV